MLLCCCAVTVGVADVAAQDYLNTRRLDTAAHIDMRAYLADHDMVYTRLPTEYSDGLILGNGVIGTLIYLEQPNRLVFLVSRSDVYSLSEKVYPHRKSIGRFALETDSPIDILPARPLRIRLFDGLLEGKLQTDNGDIEIQAFIEAEQEILTVLTRSTGTVATEWRFEGDTDPQPTRTRPSQPYFLGPFKTVPPTTGRERSASFFNLRYTEAGAPAGDITVAWDEVEAAGWLSRNSTIAYNRNQGLDTKEIALTMLETARTYAIESRRRRHMDVWNEFMSRRFVSIPDKKLESFYYIQYYKMRSATRVGGNLVDLQATWVDPRSPWPAVWHNLNSQIAYWILNTGNAPELTEPLIRSMLENQHRFGTMAGPYEGAYALHSITTADFVSPGPGDSFVLLYDDIPADFKRDNPMPSVFHRATFGNFLWLCHNLWLTHRYSMDADLLTEIIYPMLVRGVRLYQHVMYEEADDRLHLPMMYSPEYTYAKDLNYDLTMVRWAVDILLQHAQATGDVDDGKVTEWQDIEARLAEYPYDANEGFMIGADTRLQNPHRHYSHLLMIYPFFAVNIEQPGNLEKIRRSVDHWLSFADDIRATNSDFAVSGYSLTGAASMYASIGEGERAYAYLDAFVDTYGGANISRGNTHYFEHSDSAMTQEVSLTGAVSLNDMLLQSWDGKLRIFPALPMHWDDVAFASLRAEGAFLVSAERNQGELTRLHIKSLAGAPCHVKAKGLQRLVASSGGNDTRIEFVGDDEATVQLAVGEEILLVADIAPANMLPVAADVQGDTNFFGLKEPIN